MQADFDEALAVRRALSQKTADVHVACAVLGDPTLRRAYDLARVGEAASDKFVHAKALTVEFAKEAIPDVDLNEVRRHAWQTLLRTTVFVAGVTAKASEVTGAVSRQIRQEAAKRITQYPPFACGDWVVGDVLGIVGTQRPDCAHGRL